MRWLPWLLLIPFVALAQPDPSALAPGTFDLTITEADGAERLVEGWAAVHGYPAALGGWTLVLDDGEDLVAIERATAPDLDGAAFADARDVVEDDAARAYLESLSDPDAWFPGLTASSWIVHVEGGPDRQV